MTADTLASRLWIVAFACAFASVALGLLVAHRPPGAIDLAGQHLRGYAVPVALAFTRLGRGPGVAAVAVAALGIAFWLRAGRWAVAAIVLAQILSQTANMLEKLAFRRLRPDWVLGPRDADLSFPSGHSATAIVLFFGLAVLVTRAPLPRSATIPVAVILGVCAVAIPWSRLALGAHYVTDVAGGLLVGTAWLCATMAVLVRAA